MASHQQPSRQHQRLKPHQTVEHNQNALLQDEQNYQGSDQFVIRVREQIQQRLTQQQMKNMDSPQMMLDSVDERPNIQQTPQDHQKTMNQVNNQQPTDEYSQTRSHSQSIPMNQAQSRDDRHLQKGSSRTKTVDLSGARPYQSRTSLQESPADSIGDPNSKSNQKFQAYKQMLEQYQKNQEEEFEEEEEFENMEQVDDNNEYEDDHFEEDKERMDDQEDEEEAFNTQQDDEEGQSPNNEYPVQEMDQNYYQQIVDELIQENDHLKNELSSTQNKLDKVENQLHKTKNMLREVGNIRNEIIHLKQTAEEADDMDSVVAENEILKAKVGELETKVNTMSKSEEDINEMRNREKQMMERKFNDLKDEHYKAIEKMKGQQSQAEKLEYGLDQANKIIEIRDQSIKEMEQNYLLLNEEHFNVLKENKGILTKMHELQQELVQIKAQEQERLNSSHNYFTGPVSGRSQHFGQQDNSYANNKQYIALRNRGHSSEKQGNIALYGMNQNNGRENQQHQMSGSDNTNDDISRGDTMGQNLISYNDINKRHSSNLPFQGLSDFQPHSFNLDEESHIQGQPVHSNNHVSNQKHSHYIDREYSPDRDRENQNKYSNLQGARQYQDKHRQIHEEKLSMSQIQGPNDKTPTKQPIKIYISSPSKQNKALIDKCQKLEEYCRQLARTNKILDCENRLAISQLLHLTEGGQQLNNLINAIDIVSGSGQIYENRRTLCSSGQKRARTNQQDQKRDHSGYKTLNTSKIVSKRESMQPKRANQTQKSGSKSLKNLIQLRSGGGHHQVGQNEEKNYNTITVSRGITYPETNQIAQNLLNNNYIIEASDTGVQNIKSNFKPASTESSDKYNKLKSLKAQEKLNKTQMGTITELPLQRNIFQDQNTHNSIPSETSLQNIYPKATVERQEKLNQRSNELTTERGQKESIELDIAQNNTLMYQGQ